MSNKNHHKSTSVPIKTRTHGTADYCSHTQILTDFVTVQPDSSVPLRCTEHFNIFQRVVTVFCFTGWFILKGVIDTNVTMAPWQQPHTRGGSSSTFCYITHDRNTFISNGEDNAGFRLVLVSKYEQQSWRRSLAFIHRPTNPGRRGREEPGWEWCWSGVELRLLMSGPDCCAHTFTETWLHPDAPDRAVELDRWTAFQADRAQDYRERGTQPRGTTDKGMLATSRWTSWSV